MYDRILVPTDGSDGTSKTLDHAVHAAECSGGTVHLLYVVDERLYRAADADTQDEVVATLEEEGEQALADGVARFESAGIEVERERRQGVPHREIVDHAAEADADLVVMGTHGRTGRDRVAALGSVTERVLEAVDVPVLVVDIADGSD